MTNVVVGVVVVVGFVVVVDVIWFIHSPKPKQIAGTPAKTKARLNKYLRNRSVAPPAGPGHVAKLQAIVICFRPATHHQISVCPSPFPRDSSAATNPIAAQVGADIVVDQQCFQRAGVFTGSVVQQKHAAASLVQVSALSVFKPMVWIPRYPDFEWAQRVFLPESADYLFAGLNHRRIKRACQHLRSDDSTRSRHQG